MGCFMLHTFLLPSPTLQREAVREMLMVFDTRELLIFLDGYYVALGLLLVCSVTEPPSRSEYTGTHMRNNSLLSCRPFIYLLKP